MPARVEEGVDLLVAAGPHQNDLLFPHAGDHEIAGVGDLALVAEEQPAAGKDLLQLPLIDLRVDVDLTTDQPLLEVKEGAQGLVPKVTKYGDHGCPPFSFYGKSLWFTCLFTG